MLCSIKPREISSAFLIIFSLLCYPAAEAASVNPDEVVLEENGIIITLGDVAEYVSDRVLPQAYKSAVSKPGAVAQSVGNLYIIRRAAQLAKRQDLVGSYRLAFVARDAADREAVEKYVDWQTKERLNSVDWEALAKEQYIRDAERYAAEERVRVSHILVSRDGRSFNELTARVAEVDERIRKGEPFDLIAAEMSDDTSVELNRGSLGFIKRGDTVGPFEEMAFSMSEEGSVSEPVLTIFGVHFLRYEGREAGEVTAFESVQERIIEQLQKKRSQVTRDLILEPYRGEVQDQLFAIDEARLAEGMLELLDERIP